MCERLQVGDRQLAKCRTGGGVQAEPGDRDFARGACKFARDMEEREIQLGQVGLDGRRASRIEDSAGRRLFDAQGGRQFASDGATGRRVTARRCRARSGARGDDRGDENDDGAED